MKENDLIIKPYQHSGYFWYPRNSWCGWHTNQDIPGERLYLVYASEDNKSFFRYRDPETNKVVTITEPKGWSINRFTVPYIEDSQIWHCVFSYTNRISIGFRELNA